MSPPMARRFLPVSHVPPPEHTAPTAAPAGVVGFAADVTGCHSGLNGRVSAGVGGRLWPPQRHFGHANGKNNGQNGQKTPLAWPRRRSRDQRDARMAKGTPLAAVGEVE